MQVMETDESPLRGSVWNSVASFFTSVRTTIALLFLLAAASVLGTVIPQDVGLSQIAPSSGSFYQKLAAILDLHKVYRSWWFILLLVFLSLNLVGCLSKRLRSIFGELKAGSGKDSFRFLVSDIRPPTEVQALIDNVLNPVMGAPDQISKNGGTIRISWSKNKIYLLGFPLIHMAVIAILLGALIGLVYGFKGTIQIKEGSTGSSFTLSGSGQTRPLPFEIAVDAFTLTRYPTGEPKEFRSDVRILRNGMELSKGSILVNHPLTFDHISLYQSDYRVIGVKEVKLGVIDSAGALISFSLRPHVAGAVPGAEYTANLLSLDPGATKKGPGVEISLTKDGEKAGQVKLFRNDREPVEVGNLRLRFLEYQPLYATGLQIGYDPGAQVVWIGCIFLIIGFFISLFTNLRRVHVEIAVKNAQTTIRVSGRSRKMRREFREAIETTIRKAFPSG